MDAVHVVMAACFGAALCYFILWLRSNFVTIANRLGEIRETLECPGRTSKTDARGDDVDAEDDDVRGQIGFTPEEGGE